MPVLNWIGKAAVVKHHKEVPYRLLEPVPELSCGDADSGNLIVQGDNLHALKALLPRYAGQVKCIYIDPPYNTGNEGWAYNDNVNSPEIRKWLGEVVGKEGETLDRHDRWLCMMYPRLVLLRQFLRDDGFIFVSLDDNEIATLKLLLVELFGERNFVAQIIVEANRRGQTYKQISKTHEYLLCFQKSDAAFLNELQTDGENLNKADEFGGFAPRELRNRNPKFGRFNRPNLFYPIYVNPSNPNARGEHQVSATYEKDFVEVLPYNSQGIESCWRWGLPKLNEAQQAGVKTIFASQTRGGEWRIFEKYRKESVKAKTVWTDTEFISEQGTYVLGELGLADVFQFPKPPGLIRRCIELATDAGDLILDSFGGSGTTAHAVMSQNTEDEGDRHFILVEMDEGIARNVTAERVRRIAQGYTNAKGDAVAGLGGGFQFCRLSAQPLFTADGRIRTDVRFAELAEYVWFAETGAGRTPPRRNRVGSPLLGMMNGTAVFLLYNGILADRTDVGGNVLNGRTLDLLREELAGEGAESWVVYAARTRFDKARLNQLGIVFKQLPYELAVNTWS
jgi:adenine-specific DNA-methyltransferase